MHFYFTFSSFLSVTCHRLPENMSDVRASLLPFFLAQETTHSWKLPAHTAGCDRIVNIVFSLGQVKTGVYFRDKTCN